MAILETVTFGKTLMASLAHIPSITCVSTQAMIDKTYLKWLDIAKLLNAFPKHIQLVGDMVVFQGPVAIVLPWSPTQKYVMLSASVAAFGVVLFIFARSIAWLISTIQREPLSKRQWLPFYICCIIGGLYGTIAVMCLLPTQGAVVFPGQPPFYA